MGYINYFSGIVKVLEKPTYTLLKNQITLLTVRAEVPQSRSKRLIIMQFWANISSKTYYQINDYLLVEGSISTQKIRPLSLNGSESKQIILTVLKVYPVALKSIHPFSKF